MQKYLQKHSIGDFVKMWEEARDFKTDPKPVTYVTENQQTQVSKFGVFSLVKWVTAQEQEQGSSRKPTEGQGLQGPCHWLCRVVVRPTSGGQTLVRWPDPRCNVTPILYAQEKKKIPLWNIAYCFYPPNILPREKINMTGMRNFITR